MIHIIVFQPCLNKISPATTSMPTAPNARKTPLNIVSDFGTSNVLSIPSLISMLPTIPDTKHKCYAQNGCNPMLIS